MLPRRKVLKGSTIFIPRRKYLPRQEMYHHENQSSYLIKNVLGFRVSNGSFLAVVTLMSLYKNFLGLWVALCILGCISQEILILVLVINYKIETSFQTKSSDLLFLQVSWGELKVIFSALVKTMEIKIISLLLQISM